MVIVHLKGSQVRISKITCTKISSLMVVLSWQLVQQSMVVLRLKGRWLETYPGHYIVFWSKTSSA